MLKSDREHWGSIAKLFHWTIVLLIILQGAVGLYMTDQPKSPRIIPWYTFHKSVGLTILALAVLRLAWRAFDARPIEPASMPAWQKFGARGGHIVLYVLIFLVPLTGWRFDSVSALRPLYWFGLFEVPHLGAPDPEGKELARDWHEWTFWALVVVAAGHAAVALVHQFVLRDNVLGRMWPDWLQPKARTSPSISVPIIAEETADAASNPNAADSTGAQPDPAPRDRA
ncbi:MAG TPA: cytochrome b [Rudaea sp.]|nr:cytochrome b [Rudaea sp.]